MLRYAAYRQYTRWIHNRLGKGVRKVAILCTLGNLQQFSSQDNKYVESDIDLKLRLATSWKKHKANPF